MTIACLYRLFFGDLILMMTVFSIWRLISMITVLFIGAFLMMTVFSIWTLISMITVLFIGAF